MSNQLIKKNYRRLKICKFYKESVLWSQRSMWSFESSFSFLQRAKKEGPTRESSALLHLQLCCTSLSLILWADQGDYLSSVPPPLNSQCHPLSPFLRVLLCIITKEDDVKSIYNTLMPLHDRCILFHESHKSSVRYNIHKCYFLVFLFWF